MTHLLTTEDLLSQLRISRKTLDNHVAAGLLPSPMRMGRRRYWQQEEVDAALVGSQPSINAPRSTTGEKHHE